MPLHFLFPAHPLRPTVPDETFVDQLTAFRSVGFSTSLVADGVIEGGKLLRGVPAGSTVIYRGWMLDAPRYERLAAAIRSAGGQPMTDVGPYLSCHHLPNWYPLLSDLTPESHVLDPGRDYEQQLRELGWGAIFVKDFVKSLKTSVGPIVRTPSAIHEVVSEMRRVRGDIEGGIVVRRVEDFDPASERRYFVLDGVAYDPDGREPPALVKDVGERIPSRFFSADGAHLRNGTLRLVEVGDGQVSDLVGWTAEAFVRMWKRWSDRPERG